MSSKWAFTLRWIRANVVGWLLASIGVAAIYCGLGILITSLGTPGTSSWSDSVSFYIAIFFALAVGGAIIGFVQWRLVLKDQLPMWLWIAISAIVGITGVASFLIESKVFSGPYFGLVQVQGGELSGLDVSFTLSGTWLIAAIILGISFGVACGVPQWLVLRHYFLNTSRWLLIVLVASLLTFLSFAALVLILSGILVTEALILIIGPIVSAAVTSPVLYDLLQHPKANSSPVPV